jgi:AcrR family transcriptional regulator
MAVKKNPRYKVSKENWIKKGLLIIRRNGSSHLTIDEIASRLKVTKGSFYHHFENIDEFEYEVANYWSTELIENMGQANTKNVADSLKRFYEAVNVKEETKFRNWSESSKFAAEALKSLDLKRIDFLFALYQTKYDQKEAKAKAYLEYGAFIGVQQLFKYMSEAEIKAATKEFMNQFRH